MKKIIILCLIASMPFLSGCNSSGWYKTGAVERVKPNAYGLGTGKNQFGAPVHTEVGW